MADFTLAVFSCILMLVTTKVADPDRSVSLLDRVNGPAGFVLPLPKSFMVREWQEQQI
jgi:hypothetical protein